MIAVREAVADEQASIRELRGALEEKVAELDKREERLIDLAEQGLPQHKIRERLNQINQDRARLEEDIRESGSALAAGADVLEVCLHLAADVRELYAAAVDSARRELNDAMFLRLFLDEDGIHGADLRKPFGEIFDASETHAVCEASPTAVLTNSAPGGGQSTTHARGAVTSLSHLVSAWRGNNPRVSTKRLMAEEGRFELPLQISPY